MKAFLPSATLLVVAFLMLAHPAKVHSQACNVSKLRIKVNNIISTGSSCQVNATISWIQQSNSANKFTNFHIWTGANYPSLLISYSKPPSPADLANSLGTFVIDNPGSSNPTLDSGYPPAAGVPLIAQTASTVVSKTPNVPAAGMDSFNVSNVLITLSSTVSCSSHFILKADVWSGQSSSDQTVQCFTTNGTFATADVNIAGQISCTTPRQFNTTISTSSPGVVSFNYQVYADEAHTSSYDPSDPLIYSGSGTATNGANFTSGPISYSSYSRDNLIVVVQVAGNPISTFGLITNTCPVTLPVNFVYFKGQRMEGSGVMLSWGTAMEQNDKGFEVQRKTGTGDFQDIAFISSKAPEGNSSLPLSYDFLDAGSYEGNGEYRLVQIDIDGQKHYSPLVVVKGKERSLLLSVYPTPSQNGAVTLSFGDAGPKDILVSDISGRIVKKVQEVATTRYLLSGLRGGIYILKVIDNSNNQTDISKIIVSR
ncbi:T9SS type A sorting domain-containing protein [Flavitalea sp. BT771]|uniref:T9SS type A sorting domain-containing protein n=1 Tax=Flavitalea sp. BT771 TaxID=3063329 RepID=UPI0026E1EB42|nr:T9SS type A sorting domain-containing protein [Flavitalea sp. BT771]MDO6435122.1 T9SS type A sorting domain-containing protein [Flavitalea sp. BT771]MDV6224173.1 T9SS type A sorting domain-containing protein [Flavitalea sp. BT771]